MFNSMALKTKILLDVGTEIGNLSVHSQPFSNFILNNSNWTLGELSEVYKEAKVLIRC